MLIVKHHLRAPQTGLTLIELMVAMTLGLIIMGAAVQVFSANKKSYRLNSALARVQENGRFAMQSMARDIRMAGYVGCRSRVQFAVNNVANGTPPNVDLAEALEGFDSGAGWGLSSTSLVDTEGNSLTPCDATAGASATCQVSDIVRLGRGSEFFSALTTNMASPSDTLALRRADFDRFDPPVAVNGNAPTQEDLMLITNCLNADVFRVSAVSHASGATTITPNAALGAAYLGGGAAQGAQLMSLVAATYFIADDGGDRDGDGNPDPISALYRLGVTDGGAVPPAVRIAEGVEMMRVTYGVNTTGDEFADDYVTAAQVNASTTYEWSDVVSVRFTLLIKSTEDFVTDVPTPVTFGATTINGGSNADRRLRLLFSQTVGLRNRVP